MSASITKDIVFDLYGDIKFNYGDIMSTDDKGDIFYQNICSRILTNFNDLKFYPSFGANLKSFIGKPVNSAMETSIKNRIVYCLNFDGFLDKDEINVITYPQRNKILVRVSVYVDGSTQEKMAEKISMNYIFSPSSGLSYAVV